MNHAPSAGLIARPVGQQFNVPYNLIVFVDGAYRYSFKVSSIAAPVIHQELIFIPPGTHHTLLFYSIFLITIPDWIEPHSL